MTLNPGVLHKAQKEIDFVIGRDRLPMLTDLPSLPYVEAIMKETFRWNTVLHMGDYAPLPDQSNLLDLSPIGLPHVTLEDDTYNGWSIPKGSIVLANIWYAITCCVIF